MEVPPPRMDSLEPVKNIPISKSQDIQIDLRNVADVSKGTVLGEYDRYNMQRMLTLSANITGEDLGGVAKPQVIARAREGRAGAARRERRDTRTGRADATDIRWT